MKFWKSKYSFGAFKKSYNNFTKAVIYFITYMISFSSKFKACREKNCAGCVEHYLKVRQSARHLCRGNCIPLLTHATRIAPNKLTAFHTIQCRGMVRKGSRAHAQLSQPAALAPARRPPKLNLLDLLPISQHTTRCLHTR